MNESTQSGDWHRDRGAGEAVDDLILKLAQPIAELVTATALSVLSLIVMAIASAIGFEQTSAGVLGGSETSTNGFAVFLAIVSAGLGLFALLVYISGLTGLHAGIKAAKVAAGQRRQYWVSHDTPPPGPGRDD